MKTKLFLTMILSLFLVVPAVMADGEEAPKTEPPKTEPAKTTRRACVRAARGQLRKDMRVCRKQSWGKCKGIRHRGKRRACVRKNNRPCYRTARATYRAARKACPRK